MIVTFMKQSQAAAYAAVWENPSQVFHYPPEENIGIVCMKKYVTRQ